jgi:Uma2 family endonuclease
VSTLTAETPIDTLAQLVERLGRILLERIRFHPYPGTATEVDVTRIEQAENRLCELVAGVLVAKPMGFRESLLAVAIAHRLREFVMPRNLGLVAGEGGIIRLFPGSVRIPDVAFVSWKRLPAGSVPHQPVPQLAPDLVVEILSRSNTAGEMDGKRYEYFRAGVEAVWIVDPERKQVTVYTGPESHVVHGPGDTLDSQPVLAGSAWNWTVCSPNWAGVRMLRIGRPVLFRAFRIGVLNLFRISCFGFRISTRRARCAPVTTEDSTGSYSHDVTTRTRNGP